MNLINLETNYDSLRRSDIELLLCQNNLSPFAQALLLLWDKKYSEVINHCAPMWSKNLSPDERAFLLQVTVAACELLFDTKKRNEHLKMWLDFPLLEQSFYAQVIYFYHRGLTHFFDGANREALDSWERGLQIAQKIKYLRGQFRLIYHIGLAYKELNEFKKALSLFDESLLIAKKCSAHRFIERIETQIRSIKHNINFYNSTEEKVFYLLKENKRKESRSLILKACLLRRKEGRSWSSRSEYVLLALDALAHNKVKRFELIFKKINDERIQLQLVELSATLFPDFEFINSKLQQLKFILFPEAKKEINRKPNLNVGNLDEVEIFVKLLKENPNGVSKNLICSSLWRFDYDPIIHENRIYKLVMNTRKYFGVKYSIINRYGGKYFLNFDFV